MKLLFISFHENEKVMQSQYNRARFLWDKLPKDYEILLN